MAYTTIDKPSDYFNTKLYTGNGSNGNAITGVGFQPDFVWIKARSQATYDHMIIDSSRGVSKNLRSNLNNAEATDTSNIASFDSDGFTLNLGAYVNGNGVTFASWNWLAGGTASSNTDGSITSSVSANTTAGFSIVSWTGSGSASTIGHGLGSKLSMYIVKNRTDNAEDWIVYHGANTSAPETDYLQLNATNATGDSSGVWNDTAPTSSVFSVGTAGSTNGSSKNMIAYCFAEKQGYSKFGSYTGNSNADGTFVYTGFKPAFFMVKATNAAENWLMVDNKRTNSFNPVDGRLIPNSSGAEETNVTPCDFLSNGVKFRFSDGAWNSSSNTYIYMAFAESPFVTGASAIPTTAR